jgi:hypothetical protein
MQHSCNCVSGSPYGSANEFEQLRQQNANNDRRIHELGLELEALKQRDYLGHIDATLPQAGTSSHHPSSFQDEFASHHSNTRACSHQCLPIRNNPRYSALPERRSEYMDNKGDLNHVGRNSCISDPYHAGPRSNEELLPQRCADINPARYLDGIIARDDLLLGIDRHYAPVEVAAPLQEDNPFEGMTSRKLIHALDVHYRSELTIEPGRHFDNVDDDVVAAYINAGDHTTHQGQVAKVIIAGAQ